MRLVCPNCGAQYEINAALVPASGRDVQCSACGHTWFQRRETVEDEQADEAGVTEPVEMAPPEDETPPPPDLEEPETDEAPEPQAEEPEAEEKPRPRKPDEAALAILREEAEREAEARRREALGLETQGDLGLSGEAPGRAERKSEPTPAEIAAASTGAVENRPAVPDAAQKSRDVFPDIDEINSSLSVAEQEAVAAREAELAVERDSASRLGFRIGFLTVVIFVAALIVLYAFAPQLAESFPSLRAPLADYVEWANARRDQVEGLMQSAVSVLGRD